MSQAEDDAVKGCATIVGILLALPFIAVGFPIIGGLILGAILTLIVDALIRAFFNLFR